MKLDLSDLCIVLGLLIAGLSSWQVSPWLTGALGGGIVAAVGIMKGR